MTGSPPLRLFVHVEEPSMKQTMDILLPTLLADQPVYFKVIDHGSKKALLSELPKRLSGYARWADPALRILVLVDRDSEDCKVLKQKLEDSAASAGLATKSHPGNQGTFQVVNRIVIEELEAWFFGDARALAAGYPGVPESFAAKAAYRDPDAIKGGTWETLLRLLKAAGHYTNADRLPKLEVARRVAANMQPERNASSSFQAFVTGLTALVH